MRNEEILAIIPARGGSKGIPGKNMRPLNGKPLLAHTIEHARQTPQITRIVVSTDDPIIGQVALAYGAEVIWRPLEISGDKDSSESALQHVLDTLLEREGYEAQLVVFLQATSPMRRPDDIQRAIETLKNEQADSLFSGCPVHGFVWRRKGENIESFSFDYRKRQMRQDAPQDFIENGSIYVFKPWVLRRFGNRFGGKIALYEMAYLNSFQVDEPSDLLLIEQLMSTRPQSNLPDLNHIRLLVLDFDGVLTDNRVMVTETGQEAVLAHRGDGWGIARLQEAGVEVFVLSSEQNPVVAARCRKLGIAHIQDTDDKLAALQELARKKGLAATEVAFVGSDVNDLECLQWVGIPIAVQDATDAVRSAATWITNLPGGFGAVREVCDLILEQRGLLGRDLVEEEYG
jgi:YrbI family 3-deoxy-D-manno-octulosonate 8-phosphate phosphatase